MRMTPEMAPKPAPAARPAPQGATTPGQTPGFIECGVCGYEPAEQGSVPKCACPKCGAADWRRQYRPDHAPASQPGQPLGRVSRPLAPGLTSVVKDPNRVFLPKVMSRQVRFRHVPRPAAV